MLDLTARAQAIIDYIDSCAIKKVSKPTSSKKMAASSGKWPNPSKEYDSNNLFAKIVRKEIPCYKIFETEKALAFLDLFPSAPGHSLLITKGPYTTIMDMPPQEAAAYLQELPRLSKAVQQATGAEAINILSNNGKAAGQIIPQVHYH